MKKILFTLFVPLAIAVGCSDYLDVNHNPDVIEEIPSPKVLLPSAELNVAGNLMGWHFGFGAGYWVQYWTQSYNASQFKSLCEYLPQDFNTAYQSILTGALNNLKRISELSKEDPALQSYYFIGEALSIFTWQIVTDVWGDIPYSEALRGNELLLNPKFDKQEDIYADLNSRIDALLALDLSDAAAPDGKYDIIYGGDIDKWYAFAGALKLKLALRLSETSGYSNADVLTYIENANTALLTSSAKVAAGTWSDGEEGKRHPMREFQQGGANYFSQNVIACKSFLDYLTVNNDPRAAKLFSGTRGAFFGDFDSNGDSDGNGTTDDKETYATSAFQAATAPAIYMDLMVMSDWEVNFYIAEVYARANDLTNAKKYYDAGVTASLTQQGITATDIIKTGYAVFTATAQEAAIKQIAMQKWVANCNYQHIESFLERNRTKYPAVNDIDIKSNRLTAWANFPVGDLTISVNGRALLNAQLPASPQYPASVLTRNSNAPGQKADVAQKVWWNQKAGK
ncbi:hypothetical protein FACS1894156_2110 [Bacteroidia bacterium]|nr:hypothetical protein FACS1894156_2110 [Bacteroidia bacterium]